MLTAIIVSVVMVVAVMMCACIAAGGCRHDKDYPYIVEDDDDGAVYECPDCGWLGHKWVDDVEGYGQHKPQRCEHCGRRLIWREDSKKGAKDD